jgi:septum formation protein
MLHKLLSGHKLVLASASPRRRAIFDMLGLRYVQQAADIDETIDIHAPAQIVLRHARGKAQAVADRMDCDCIVVAADTIVYLDRTVLGKPTDKKHAADLCASCRSHHVVYTGVCVRRGPVAVSGYEKTSPSRPSPSERLRY